MSRRRDDGWSKHRESGSPAKYSGQSQIRRKKHRSKNKFTQHSIKALRKRLLHVLLVQERSFVHQNSDGDSVTLKSAFVELQQSCMLPLWLVNSPCPTAKQHVNLASVFGYSMVSDYVRIILWRTRSAHKFRAKQSIPAHTTVIQHHASKRIRKRASLAPPHMVHRSRVQ